MTKKTKQYKAVLKSFKELKEEMDKIENTFDRVIIKPNINKPKQT